MGGKEWVGIERSKGRDGKHWVGRRRGEGVLSRKEERRSDMKDEVEEKV